MGNKNKLKILLLEDNSDDAELVLRELTRGHIHYTYERVDNREDFINSLKHFKPEVILSDHALPQFNSTEAFEIFKTKGSRAPFILVTGAVSEEFAVSCLKLGVDDYILKSNLTRLPVAIQNAIQQKKLENAKRKSEIALREQNKVLMKINGELDNFAYNVSHNLKAPLTSVMGLINLIKIDCQTKGEEPPELIRMMEYSIQKLDLTLINILNYSRNSKIDIKIDPINLQKIVNESFKEIRYFTGFDKIEKKVNIDYDVPFHSDKYRISVICSNIISNAVKYHDPEKSRCRITIDGKITANRAEIMIEDNGIGINQQLLPDIFNMFFRATERSDGAGLGLYIVKEMVNRINGTISVSSVETEGTTIRLIIPNLYTAG